jgi:hypothetical protein
MGTRSPSVAPAFGETVKAFDVSVDERLLLGVGPAFDLGLALLRGGPRFVTFRLDDTHRRGRLAVYLGPRPSLCTRSRSTTSEVEPT